MNRFETNEKDEPTTDSMRKKVREYSKKVRENKPVLAPKEPEGKINNTFRD
ncbi:MULTISPECIES: hypothetical protein [Marinobacter]|uniref:hypothetical protein n=1 Tax=Marinobacter TaxID=2742 RepID=UPI001D05DC90|nr:MULTISPECIES: hypothetical protein [Marinobacter]MCK7565209.1 hypothetical protein [Marinobacter xestospongiae]UDL06004.1 hypothetical protein J2887_04360 [Marinobacter sp. CA1]